jgi:hypothetical protein
MYAEYQTAAAGWPLKEALQRTADRTLLKRVNLAVLDEGPAAEDLNQLETALWTHLREGRLVATGSIKGASSKLLEPEYATDCQVVNWRESVLKRHGKHEIAVEEVRIYPALRSPDFTSRLSGMGLADAFRKFVLEDPEVAALNALQRDPSALKKGMRPGPTINFHWRLNITAETLASDYVDSHCIDLSKQLPEPSTEQYDIAFALVDRLCALRDLLASGHVTAKGTFSQTGEIVLIDSRQWTRDGIFIHATNGDLCAEQNHLPVPIWTGVSFLDSQKGTAQKSPIRRRAKKAKISAHFSSVREATYALWSDGIPNSLTRGRRDQKIIEWQRANTRTIVSDKTIGRYFDKYASLHDGKTVR